MSRSKKYIIWLQEKSAIAVFLLLFLISAFRYKQFFTTVNLMNLFRQSSIIGVIAVGMTFVIITGCIDLSVGSIVAVCGIIAAKMCSYHIAAGIFVPLLAGAFIGLVNGSFVTKLKIPPWITSLSMMMCLRGIAYLMTNESSVNVEKVSPAFQMLGRGKIAGIPVPGLIFLGAVILGTYSLKYTRFGRSVYAVGGNQEGARMMGIQSDRTIILSYMLCGMGAALSGLILASRLGAAQSTAGELYEMQVIAAVVLGGTLLTGGVGHMPGTMFGVFTMSIITNIFNMQGNISTWWQNVIMGFLILIIVIMQAGLEQIKMSTNEKK
ncbi:ABC transporter permease [Lachnospiraceae bacterium 62-35]